MSRKEEYDAMTLKKLEKAIMAVLHGILCTKNQVKKMFSTCYVINSLLR